MIQSRSGQIRLVTSPPRPCRPARLLGAVRGLLLTALALVGLFALGTVTASADTLPDNQTRVAVSAPETIFAAGGFHGVSAGEGRGPPVLRVGFVVVTGVAAESGAGSVLRASSEAAFRAANNPGAIFIKNKHLASSVGRWAKFDSTDVSEVQGWVAEGPMSLR